MDVTPLIPLGRQVIQSYGQGRFKVSSTVYESSLLVTPEETRAWSAPKTFGDLSETNFLEIKDILLGCDVILLGTGETSQFPPTDLIRTLKESGIKPEYMSTGAACRTYNVLMAEDRKVAALLFLI